MIGCMGPSITGRALTRGRIGSTQNEWRRKMVRLAGLVLLTGVLGLCLVMFRGIEETETPIRIDVAGAPSAARFLFSYCDGRHRTPELHIVEVFRPRTDGPSREECLMLWKDGSYPPLPEWRLGAPTPGFHMQGCDALPAGDYRISVSGAGTFGSATFRLAADGSAAPTSPPCR
jgi:hypothetical protein